LPHDGGRIAEDDFDALKKLVDESATEWTRVRVHGGSGRAGRAYSVIIDARGMDTTAPWPVTFHDPANTNNAQTLLSQFACP
jgi:hypothetical protein